MTDFISNLHFLNMTLVLTTGTVTAIWGFILYFISRPRSVPAQKETESEERAVAAPVPTGMYRPWRIALNVTAIDALLQGLLGVILVLLNQRPGKHGDSLYYLHYVYGGIVALVLIVGVTYTTSGKNPRRDVLILSIASLILVAAAVRALMTGPS